MHRPIRNKNLCRSNAKQMVHHIVSAENFMPHEMGNDEEADTRGL